MPSHICPCCSDTLLRHVNGKGLYWYCCSCHQEMPSLSGNLSYQAKQLSIKQSSLAQILLESTELKVSCLI